MATAASGESGTLAELTGGVAKVLDHGGSFQRRILPYLDGSSTAIVCQITWHGNSPSKMARSVTVTLGYRTPYDWHQISAFLATRAVPGVERVDERGYARTVATAGGPMIVCVRPFDGENALELPATTTSRDVIPEVSSTTCRTFGLEADPEDAGAVLRGIRCWRRWSPTP